jgi:hypothetical protein
MRRFVLALLIGCFFATAAVACDDDDEADCNEKCNRFGQCSCD